MNWQNKLGIAKQYVESNPQMVTVFDDTSGGDHDFIARLKQQYPFVEEEYLLFLRLSDGIYIDTFLLFGSEKSKFSSITNAEDTWEFIPGVRIGFIPIGMYASGDGIAICSDGKIRILSINMDFYLEGKVIADSFSSLMNNYLFGNKYTELFSSHTWTSDDETVWTQFLREQNWL